MFIDTSGLKSRKWKRERRVTVFEFAFACCTQSVAFALRGCPGEGGGRGGCCYMTTLKEKLPEVWAQTYINMLAAGRDLHFTNEIL